MSDVTIFEGRLSLKKTHHGRFEDAYKERVFCWISQRKAPVFCLVPIESGRVERPRGAAMVQEVSLRDCTLRVDDKTKFTLLGAHLPLKFRADKYTELELWIKHLKRAIDAAKQHDSDPTQSPQPRERPGHAALKSQEKSQDTTRQSPVSAPAPAFQLLQAAERGDVSSMSQLLECGVSADAAPYVGYSALMAASEHGQLPAVQCLLQAGARLDADMQGGTQAIHLAAMCGHAEVVRLLCEHGAEADASTDGGTTPLMLAAMEGHVDVCLELHAQGADANAIETSVIPELEQQIAGLQHEVIQARVAAGVTGGEGGVSGGGQTDEVADANADSISTREVCTDGGQDGVLSTVGPSIWDILTGRGGEMTSGSQNATVAAAATTDDKQHAGVAFGGLVAGTALQTMSTSFQDKLQLVYGGLLSPVPAAGGAGGDMLPRSLGEHVGLQVGAALGRGLKDASRNLSSLGLTALIKAAAAGHTRVCEALITTMGADVNAQGHRGMTALMLAVAHGHRDTTQMLAAHAANASIRDQAGNTAFEYAERAGDAEMVELMRQLFAGSSLRRAAQAASGGGILGAAAASALPLGEAARNPGSVEMSSQPRSLRAVWGAWTQDLAQSWQGQSEDARASKQLALDAPDKPLLLMGPGADALDEK